MPSSQPVDFADIDRVNREYFDRGTAFERLVHFGVNLRGLAQSDASVYEKDMAHALERRLPVALHAGQTPPNRVDTSDYEKRGWLGSKLLICHDLPASDRDAERRRSRRPTCSRRCGSRGTWESRGEARRRKGSRLSAFAR